MKDVERRIFARIIIGWSPPIPSRSLSRSRAVAEVAAGKAARRRRRSSRRHPYLGLAAAGRPFRVARRRAVKVKAWERGGLPVRKEGFGALGWSVLSAPEPGESARGG